MCIIALVVYTQVKLDSLKRISNGISFKESLDLSDLPIITFTSKGNRLNFLLDTGANISAFNSKFLELTDNKPINKKGNVLSSSGELTDAEFANINLKYKDRIYTDEFQIMNLSVAFNQVKHEYGVQIHGILGNVFLQKYKYVLDFKRYVAYEDK